MAGTTMVAFKSKMVELVSAMPEFDGVKVSYADPGDKALKEKCLVSTNHTQRR